MSEKVQLVTAANVRKLREECECSEEDAARIIQTSLDEYRRFEAGIESFPKPALAKLAWYLDVPIQAFFQPSVLQTPVNEAAEMSAAFLELTEVFFALDSVDKRRSLLEYAQQLLGGRDGPLQ